jgi:aryl-alcohol dehydrogenase-like predicted oxidoreductase
VDPDAGSAGTWPLGDRTVNRLGFGAMRLTGTAAFDLGTPRDRDASVAVLRRAVDLGVDHVDTAAFYFSPLRSANEIIGTALAPYNDDRVVVVTKVGPGRDPWGEWTERARPDQLRGQVEENLRQLGRDHLDVVNYRTSGRGPVAEHVGALADLVQAGLVRHVGVSDVDAAQLAEARAVTPIVCVQNRYAIDSRSAHTEEVLRLCGELGIAFVPFFAIAGAGTARGPSGEHPAALQAVADAHGATPAQVRLAWTLARGPHVLAIPGTGDLAHLEQNVAAAALRLEPDEIARLDGLADGSA